MSAGITIGRVASLYRYGTNHLFLLDNPNQLEELAQELSTRQIPYHKVDNISDYLDMHGITTPIMGPASAYLATISPNLIDRLGHPLGLVFQQFRNVHEIFPNAQNGRKG